jgi:hypothetical protein
VIEGELAGSTGRAIYRSPVAELMESWFGVAVPPLRLNASPGAAGDLTPFAGAYDALGPASGALRHALGAATPGRVKRSASDRTGGIDA